MKAIASLVVLTCFLVILGASQDCNDPNYVIPTTSWGSQFDLSPSDILSNKDLVNLVANPQAINIRDYALSVASVSAPLWAFAGLTLIIFLAMTCQIVLFDLVGIKACGREINTETYNPLSVRVVTSIFLAISAVAFLGSVAALIINSELFVAVKNSECNAKNILFQLYNGNNVSTQNINLNSNNVNDNSNMPWSGVNNFSSLANQIGIGIQNSVPFLQIYFNNSNALFKNLTNTSPGSMYEKAITFNCQNSDVSLSCPFVNDTICPYPLLATFNENFCKNQSQIAQPSQTTQSALTLISAQISINQQLWFDSINTLSTTLQGMNTSAAAINNLTTTYSQVATNITNYQNDVEDAFITSQNVILGMEIVLYIFYCLILILAASSFIMVVSIYFFKVFKCRFLTYILWIIYMLSGVVIFCISAVSLSIYLSQYDICSAYSYAFSSQANFNSIGFPDSDITQTLQSCYFQNGQSVFRVLSNSPLSEDIITLSDNFETAQPDSSFSSIVSTIQQNLLNYYSYPAQVQFVDQTQTSSPAYALQLANQFSNYSNPQSTQQCQVTQDLIVFNPTNCGLFPILATPPTPSCVPTAQDINSRVQAFNNIQTTQCDKQGQEYFDNFVSLQGYVDSVQQMVNDILFPSTGTSQLVNYEGNYFHYWVSMGNLMNPNINILFNTFYGPYLNLDDGASCSFLTSSINSIYQYSCNQTYKLLEGFTIINIFLACLMLILMIFAYFLTSRYEFYEYIEGDYINSGAIGMDSHRPSQVPRTLEMRNSSDWKDKQLISNRSNL